MEIWKMEMDATLNAKLKKDFNVNKPLSLNLLPV